ncbi:DUF2750 domain-containing protein [Priestia koreensis]|uniref:DUF2750 domain-containing protein n=1 Tax=Priestia koreensis TaxID=284581 RepID=UPI001F57400F|nr:DUF2750 domain-containing protein [Priestia koreensis]UNL86624.1 DUF2750 domain-containing protein [Priestia koreensis]
MKHRIGLRIRSEKGVHEEVRKACLAFANWLRWQMEFPMRVVVYLKKKEQIRSNGEWVSASFFAPFSLEEEPYMRIATGDYPQLIEELGREDALLAILISFAHEIIHYQQWLDGREFSEQEAEEQGERLVYDYCDDQAFFEDVLEMKRVWTIENEEGTALFTNEQGESLMPFWSKEEKAHKIIHSVAFYRDHKTISIATEEFMEEWLPELQEEGYQVGLNMYSRSLIGREMEPSTVLERLEEERRKGGS